MARPLLIGLTGKAQSGKDTFYRYAVKAFPEKKVQRIAFADEVRDMAEAYFGWDPEGDKEGQRHILQGIGMMVRKEFDEDFWLDIGSSKIEWDSDIVIFTDCRFPNELAAIEAGGGRSVRVVSMDYGRGGGKEHESETALDSWEVDDVVCNSGDADFLHTVRESIEYYEEKVALDREVDELAALVVGWAKDRNLLEGSTLKDQYLKLMEEYSEFEAATSDDLQDAIGDMAVVLIIMTALALPNFRHGIGSFVQEMNRLRKKAVYDGHHNHYGLAYLLGTLGGHLARGETRPSLRAIALIYDELVKLSYSYNKDIGTCLAAAWDEIKDRKGKMIDGVFVKEGDL